MTPTTITAVLKFEWDYLYGSSFIKKYIVNSMEIFIHKVVFRNNSDKVGIDCYG